MCIPMLFKWLKILCLFTTFCARNLNFGVQHSLNSATPEFKLPDSYVNATGSTLALYACFLVLWGVTICHVPCLTRHIASCKFLLLNASELVTMRFNFKFLASTKFNLLDPYVHIYAQDSTLIQNACFNVSWKFICPNVLCLLRHVACDALLIFLVTTLVTT